MTLSFEDRDRIALKVLRENYGTVTRFEEALDSGEFDISTLTRLIREGIERAGQEESFRSAEPQHGQSAYGTGNGFGNG